MLFFKKIWNITAIIKKILYAMVFLFLLTNPLYLFAGSKLFLSATEKEWIKKNPAITLSVDNTYPLKNYINKKVDAYIGSLAVISFYIKKTGFTNLKVSGETPYSYKLSMGVCKDWPILVNILNKAYKAVPDNEKNNSFKKWIAIKYEHEFSYITICKIAAVFGLVFIFIFAWNLSLKKQVHIKTFQLNKELIKVKSIEKKIKNSLKEKEILLKEVHHRVKNNMQIISSLLSLQSDAVKNKKFKELIQVSQNRIISMGLVHEHLYNSNNFSRINFSNFISSLVKQLLQSYHIGNKIKLTLDVKNIFLSIEKAIPCALCINELVVNTIKYAFPENKSGKIYIKLVKKDRKNISLFIADNGIGISKDIDLEKTQTLGLQLVYQLIHQIDGKLTLKKEMGTAYEIVFPS